MLTILVVLFDCQITNSQTLKAINTYLDVNHWEKINIHVFNNGPAYLNDNGSLPLQAKKRCLVELHQNINNLPLSWIYNQFIPTEGVYLLLDQDTTLTAEYFSHLVRFSKTEADIFAPKLEHPGHKAYPICPIHLNTGLVKVPSLFSVLSGLAIKKTLMQDVEARYGNLFDSRFAFYGIDATFFIRLKKMNINNYYIGSLIYHDLSGGLSLKQIDYWRYRERAIDTVLQLRNYPSLRCSLEFIKFFLRSPKIAFLKTIPVICKVFIKGMHPKCL